MKYIIIYEDDGRTVVFKSESKKRVDEWFETTINDIKESGGSVMLKFHDVAWGYLLNENFWKITIYSEHEIYSPKRIGF